MSAGQTALQQRIIDAAFPAGDITLREVKKVVGGDNASLGVALRALSWTSRVDHPGGRTRRIWTAPAPTVEDVSAKLTTESELRVKVRTLEEALKAARKNTVDSEYVRTQLLRVSSLSPTPPNWVAAPSKSASKSPGVPTLLASDWHWGEIVSAGQVSGVNEYDISTAQRRARRLIEGTVELLHRHMVNPNYPGIVFALGGDMVSGDIHEELSATNETEIMPVILDLFGVLIWCIDALKHNFGKVFVPAVSGNHARTTQKIRSKGRNHTSFDWLLYHLLARHFEKDADVSFLIPDGPDTLYSLYGHRYLLTHGDQFRGGDGMIGALGPIIRGDHRKRSRNNQVGQGYDTMLLGHWHQLIQLQRLIVNGSLVGYNEYAYNYNFPFEPPRQALWVTHPVHGITFSMPVLVEPEPAKRGGAWVEWKA